MYFFAFEFEIMKVFQAAGDLLSHVISHKIIKMQTLIGKNVFCREQLSDGDFSFLLILTKTPTSLLC